MEDSFDICLGDPEQVDMAVYDLWIQGLTVEEAVSRRMNSLAQAIRRLHHMAASSLMSLSSRRSNAPEEITLGALEEAEVTRILRQDTSDSFRLFEILEKFLYQPEVFRVQSICQLALPDRLKMAEKYYELDDAVAREILTRRPTAKKVAKELDEISEVTQVAIRSVRRQYDNLRRAYSYIEEQRSFSAEEQKCIVCEDLSRFLLLPDTLACKYTVCIFITFHKFNWGGLVPSSSRRRQPPLSFADMEYLALAILIYWAPDVRNLVQGSGAGLMMHTPILPPSSVLLSPTLDGSGAALRGDPSLLMGTPSLLRESSVGRDTEGGSSLPPTGLPMNSRRSESFTAMAGDMGITWMEAAAGATLVLQEVLVEEGSAGSWSKVTPSHRILQDALRNVCGVELDKVLLSNLRDLSRFFNDSTAMDQFQGLVIAFLAGQGQGSSSSSVMTSSLSSALPSPFAYLTSASSTTNSATNTPATSTPMGGAAPPLGVVMDTAKILLIARKFRSIMRPLLTLGWGLQQQKELRDLFEDVVGKVSEPLRELSLSKRDTCSLFVAMMHSLSAVPLLADKVAPVRRQLMFSLSWTRFLSGVVLCLLRTFDRWAHSSPFHSISGFSGGSRGSH